MHGEPVALGVDDDLAENLEVRRVAHLRDSLRALPRTRRSTGVRTRPAVAGPGGAVAAVVAARVKVSTFSCHIRVYSRRSRALGGHPPVSIRAVLYPITSGAVQAISHICIQGAIQSVADGALARVLLPVMGESRSSGKLPFGVSAVLAG
jgi:hypothetical protein